MPTVVFNYNNTTSTVLDHYTDELVLPNNPPKNARWFLRSVQAVYFDNSKEDFRTIEISVPQLFENDRVRFFSGSEGVNTSPPENTLRFFVNNLIAGGEISDSAFKSVSLTPNLNLGRHSLDTRLFKIVVTARKGGGTRDPVKIRGYSIVFEYE